MKKKLVFLALALVLVLACAVAAAAPAYQNGNSMHWENTGTKAVDLVGKTIKIADGTDVEVLNVEIHKEPTCTEAAQWKIYYKDYTGLEAKNVFVIGYFNEGYKRAHDGHVWASDFAWDKGIKSVTLDPKTGVYSVTYANGTTTELHGSVMIKEPTCTAKGESYDFCVYCGTVNKDKKQEVPKLDHTYVEKAKGDWEDCLHQGKEMHTEFRCKYCNTLQLNSDGTAKQGKLTWTEAKTAAEANGAVKGADGKLWKLLSEKGNNFVADYVAAGYEVKTGHKWDGWTTAVGATPCMNFRHCQICEQTQSNKLDPDWKATGDVKIINCYLATQANVCARCNGETPGHEAHIYYIYSGNATEAAADETKITEGALGVQGATSIKALYAICPSDFVLLNKGTEPGETKENHAYHVKEHNYYLYNDTQKEDAEVYELGVTGRNSCVDRYIEVFKCSKCGKEDIKVAHGPKGHQMLDWELVYAPGQGENVEGEWIRKCFKCGWTEKYHGTSAPAADFVQEWYDVNNGLQFRDGKWGWYSDNKLQAGVNGLVPYNGAWFLLKDGILDTSYEDLYTYDGAQFYVSAGKIRNDLQGFVNTKKGFFYFGDGMVQKVTTLVQYDGEWFYIIDGELAIGYYGVVEYPAGSGHHFTVENSQVVGQID